VGFYFRKSAKLGPVRVNFSKSGIGVSTGVRGARISTGPRGTHINAGWGGFYYRQKIGPSPYTSKPGPAVSGIRPHSMAASRRAPIVAVVAGGLALVGLFLHPVLFLIFAAVAVTAALLAVGSNRASRTMPVTDTLDQDALEPLTIATPTIISAPSEAEAIGTFREWQGKERDYIKDMVTTILSSHRSEQESALARLQRWAYTAPDERPQIDGRALSQQALELAISDIQLHLRWTVA
jgi:hypothetical protein